MILMMLFLWVTFIFATDLMVVGEVFSTTTCPSCPAARSALYSFYQNHPDRVIPLIWNTTVDQYASTRYYDYPHPDGPYVPYYAVGGDDAQTGGQNVNSFEAIYNSISGNPSPITISLDYSISGTNLNIAADVMVDNNLSVAAGASVEYFFAVTNHDPSNGDYRSRVTSFSGYNNFPLRNSGENNIYTGTLSYGDSPLNKYIVMVIQERTSGGELQTIYQGATVLVDPFEANFASDITSGPLDLEVKFTDLSLVTYPEYLVYNWNFGDGSPISSDASPIHTYTQTGTYDVELIIIDGVTSKMDTLLIENYIEVVDPSAGVSGEAAGHWKPEYGDYYVTGPITVSEEKQLTIDPGTHVYFDQAAGIEVGGTITITGNETDQVILNGNPSSRSMWNGIQINSDNPLNIISNCVFKNFRNTAVKLNSAKVTLNNCTFRDGNVVTNAPGVFDIYGCSNITISDVYGYNISVADGYSFADMNTSTDIKFDRVVFANSSSVQSGIINTEFSEIEVSNCLFVNNDARTRCFNLLSTSTMTFINTTVLNNNLTTPSTVKGIFFPYSGNLNIMNSIIDNGDNTEINELADATVTVTYTAIRGGYTGTGNIDTENSDPMFTMPSDGVGQGFDGMKNWTLQAGSPCIDAGNPDAMYNDIEDPDNSGNALPPALGTVTNDMGAYGFNGCLPTENIVIANDDDFIPEARDFVVAQDIYPNPFNPKTNIQLNIGKNPQTVTLNVYNVRGQLVKTLVNNEVMSGTKNVIWDGTDNSNNAVSTGVYFSSVHVGNETSTKKMVLLK